MAQPGETYGHLVRSTAGATPQDPCPSYCTRQDAKDWRASAEAVAAAVEYQIDQVAGLASERGQVLDAALEIDVQSYFQDLEANTIPPDRSLPTQFRATIDRSIANLRRAGVILERLDAASLRLGVPAPAIPGFPRKAPRKSLELIPTVIGVVAVAALGAAVYYAARKSDPPPALPEPEIV